MTRESLGLPAEAPEAPIEPQFLALAENYKRAKEMFERASSEYANVMEQVNQQFPQVTRLLVQLNEYQRILDGTAEEMKALAKKAARTLQHEKIRAVFTNPSVTKVDHVQLLMLCPQVASYPGLLNVDINLEAFKRAVIDGLIPEDVAQKVQSVVAKTTAGAVRVYGL